MAFIKTIQILCLIGMFCLISSIASIPSAEKNSMIKDTMKILKEMTTFLSNEDKNVTIVLGNEADGFLHWITNREYTSENTNFSDYDSILHKFVDEETGEMFHYYPGYGERGNEPSREIVSAMSLKASLANSNGFKILLYMKSLSDVSSVLKVVTGFLNNNTKSFSESFGLVLEDPIPIMLSMEKLLTSNLTNQNSKLLIQTILDTDNGNKTRIIQFDKQAVVNESTNPFWKQTRGVLHNNIHFSNLSINGNSLYISKASRGYIADLIDHMNRNIESNTLLIKEYVTECIKSLNTEVTQIIKLYETKSTLIPNFEKLNNLVMQFSQLREMAQMILSYLTTPNFEINLYSNFLKENVFIQFSNIALYEKYLTILNSMHNKQTDSPIGKNLEIIGLDIIFAEKDVSSGILKTMSHIAIQIEQKMESIAENINIHFSDTLGKDSKFSGKMHQMAYIYISKVLSKINDFTSAKVLIQDLRNSLRNIGIELPRNTVEYILLENRYLETFALLNGKTETSLKWIEPIKRLLKDLREPMMLYDFIVTTHYELLSDFDQLSNWSRSLSNDSNVTLPIIFEKFQQFALKKYNVTLSSFEKFIKLKQWYSDEWKDLMELIRGSLSATDIECDGDKLIIKGHIVKFSDFIDEYGNLTTACANTVIRLDVFSTGLLVLDRDFSAKGKIKTMNVIAPIWSVNGLRRISLDGADGEPHERLKNETFIFDTNNRYVKNGIPGKPGKPGGQGGSFYGYGIKIVNGENLTISANGGFGGPGQDGGNGKDGEFGTDAEQPDHNCENFDECIPNIYGTNIKSCLLYGSLGADGGDGGDGGDAGIPGFPGTIAIFFWKNTYSGINIESKSPHNIKHPKGLGGSGGIGGKHGDVIFFQCDLKGFFFPVLYLIEDSIIVFEHEEGESGASGSKGKTGGNSEGKVHPTKIPSVNDFPKAIILYKSLLREKIANSVLNDTYVEFLEQLETDENVTKMFSDHDFFWDFYSIEIQYHKNLKNSKIVLSSYKHLLQRVEKFNNTNLNENQSIFRQSLYSAIHSKVNLIKNDFQHDVIVNIDLYLTDVQKNIEKLKSTDYKIFLKSHIKKYEHEVEKKINESMLFVEEHLLERIYRINYEIDSEIDYALNYINELAVNIEIKKQLLKEKLLEAIHLKKVSGFIEKIFKVIELALNFMGRSAFSTGFSRVRRASDNADYNAKFKSNDVLSLINDVEKDRYSSLRNSAVYLLDITTNSSDLNDLHNEISDIVNKIDKNETDIETLEGQLNSVVYTKKAKVLASQYNDKSSMKYLNHVDGIISNVRIGGAVEIIKKFKNFWPDREKSIEDITEVIENVELSIRELQYIEKGIYDVLTPLFNNMKQSFTNLVEISNDDSQIDFEIFYLNMRNALLKMKHVLKALSLSEDFSHLDTSFELYREQLLEILTAVSRNCIKIQGYKENKKLVNFIARSWDSVESGRDLKPFHELEMKLDKLSRSYLILHQFKQASQVFAQWVFPYAELCPGYVSKLSTNLAVDPSNVNQSVSWAIEKISQMETCIRRHRSTIRHGDQYRRSGDFHKSTSTEPFYVWKSEKYSISISRLLSGRKITLNADVAHSPPDKDAVKFTTLEIKFRALDGLLQEDLEKKLEGYKAVLTHMGNSYYRYKNKTYIIPTESAVTIDYNFERNKDGTPIHRNWVYDKIANGSVMLSPYAMWEMKLVPTKSHFRFCELTEYGNIVDLELVGTGTYISHDSGSVTLLKESNYEWEVEQNPENKLYIDRDIYLTGDLNLTLPGCNENTIFINS